MTQDENWVYFTWEEAHLFNPKLEGDEYKISKQDWIAYETDFLYPDQERGQFTSEVTSTTFRRPLPNWSQYNPHFL